MARPLRITVSEGIYHVMTRGDNKELIYIDELDYQKYKDLLVRYKKKFDFELLCYALMPNHVHLIIRTSDKGNISQIMQGINLSYTIYFNRRYCRVGHVFQGRFKSFLVQKGTYLLELSRYIHLNPLRANISQTINSYPYTSCHCYIGSNHDRLMSCNHILDSIDEDHNKAKKKYLDYINEGISNGGQVLPPKVLVEPLSQT